MHFHGFCPRCNTEIPRDRYTTGFAICECGWSDPTPFVKARDQREKKAVIILSIVAVVAILLYGHLVSWGSYAGKIPFVRLMQVTGTLPKEGYLELGRVCISLDKFNCAKKAFVGMYKSSGDPEGLAHLAYLQSRLKEQDAALASYASYLKVGGRNGESLLKYAKLLEESGQADQAIAMYDASIEARPDILPVNATTGIVRLLIKQGRYQDAHERILAFHESAGNAKGYLNTELQQLETYFAQTKTASKMKSKRRA